MTGSMVVHPNSRAPRELVVGLALAAALVAAGCSGAGAGRRGAAGADEELDGERPSFGSESAGEQVGVLTEALALRGFENLGCMDLEVLGSAELEQPVGRAFVFVAGLCEGYEEHGRVAFIASAVGNEFIMSNTLHALPAVGRPRTDSVEVLSLEAPRSSRHGPNLVVLRYRTPPEGRDGDWMEQLVVGTFSAEALDMAVVQPLRFDVRLGGGRLVGEGAHELADADGDGDLDLTMRLRATGRGCRRGGACRNGEHACEVTVPFARSGYDVVLTGDDCLYLGRLEL